MVGGRAWLLVLPEVDRVVSLVGGEVTVALVLGTALVAGLILLAVWVKPQFSARAVRGNVPAAAVLFRSVGW
jgi:hypothetical protein